MNQLQISYITHFEISLSGINVNRAIINSPKDVFGAVVIATIPFRYESVDIIHGMIESQEIENCLKLANIIGVDFIAMLKSYASNILKYSKLNPPKEKYSIYS